MDLTIVVPCFNEVGNVADLHARLLPVATELGTRSQVEILFVDDGSTDHTYDALCETFRDARAAGVQIRIERHPINRGLGAALRTGTTAAQGTIVVSTDSDGTYEFGQIPGLLSHLTADVDIVTASAFHPDGTVVGVPARRMILSRGASTLYRLLVGAHLHTYTCLFRAYRREVFDHVSWDSNDFLGVTEVLVRAMLMGYSVTEAPATLRTRAHGVSKARLARTVIAHLRFLSRVALHQLKVVPLVEPRHTRPSRDVV